MSTVNVSIFLSILCRITKNGSCKIKSTCIFASAIGCYKCF